MARYGKPRWRDYRGDLPLVAYRDVRPADLASIVIGLRESRSCGGAADLIARGRWTLRQLRRQRLTPAPEIMEAWRKQLKSFKRACR